MSRHHATCDNLDLISRHLSDKCVATSVEVEFIGGRHDQPVVVYLESINAVCVEAYHIGTDFLDVCVGTAVEVQFLRIVNPEIVTNGNLQRSCVDLEAKIATSIETHRVASRFGDVCIGAAVEVELLSSCKVNIGR